MLSEIRDLGTEQRNERTMDLDLLPTMQILEIMNEEDLNVTAGVRKALPQIEKAVDAMVKTLSEGGRIIYAGAGTSGRTGVIDAVECGPTFSCTDEFIALMCGGNGAVFKAVEGAEDRGDLCVEDLKNCSYTNKDLFVGIAASGRTPYVIGGIEYAKQMGGKTACVCCNLNSKIGSLVDYPIEVDVGPEVLAGSTRLKSGTAQKVIINMLSTVTMIRMGKVYKNLIIDGVATNSKLVERIRHTIMAATGCDYETADQTLKITGNRCKEAVVMILLNTDLETAKAKLEAADGFVRKAVG